MSDNLDWWRGFELYKHVEAVEAVQAQATTDTDDGQSISQPQQYDLPSALVDSYENSTPADTQHQITHWGHSISNDQGLSSAGQHGAGLSQIDLPKVYSAVGQPLHNSCPSETPQSQSRCLWAPGQCSFAEDTVKSVIDHIASDHLPKPVLAARRVECQVCSPPKTMRRDTILRHLREAHYGESR